MNKKVIEGKKYRKKEEGSLNFSSPAKYINCSFYDVSIKGHMSDVVSFVDCIFVGCSFPQGQINSTFRRCELRSVVFKRSMLTKTVFSDSLLKNCFLDNCVGWGVTRFVDNCILEGVTGSTPIAVKTLSGGRLALVSKNITSGTYNKNNYSPYTSYTYNKPLTPEIEKRRERHESSPEKKIFGPIELKEISLAYFSSPVDEILCKKKSRFQYYWTSEAPNKSEEEDTIYEYEYGQEYGFGRSLVLATNNLDVLIKASQNAKRS